MLLGVIFFREGYQTKASQYLSPLQRLDMGNWIPVILQVGGDVAFPTWFSFALSAASKLPAYSQEAYCQSSAKDHNTSLHNITSVFVGFGSIERLRNGIFGILPAQKMGREPFITLYYWSSPKLHRNACYGKLFLTQATTILGLTSVGKIIFILQDCSVLRLMGNETVTNIIVNWTSKMIPL